MMIMKQVASSRTVASPIAGARCRLSLLPVVPKCRVHASKDDKPYSSTPGPLPEVPNDGQQTPFGLPESPVKPQPTGNQGKAPASPNFQQFQVSDQNPKGGVEGGLAAGPGSQIGVRFLWEQEAINGRAAMLGFVAAVISEINTNRSVIQQLFGGRDENFALQSAPNYNSLWAFFALWITVAIATSIPRWRENLALDAISFGPFTPKLERVVGWTAMLGFFGLVVTELIKGSPVF